MLVSQTITDHNLPRPFTQWLVGGTKEEGREEEGSGDFEQDSILRNVIILTCYIIVHVTLCVTSCSYRAFSCDVTVTWKPYGRPFWCTVEWKLSMRQVAHAKCSPNLTTDGLTSQVCSISLPGTCYIWDVIALVA